MKKYLLIITILISGLAANCQAIFHPVVKIEFEKVVYVKQLYKSLEPGWYEMIKDRLPETSVTYFDFIGDTAHSIYKPGKEVAYHPRSFYQGLADRNVVFTDYRNQKMIAQKPVFEETFLVEDNLPKVTWKITADTRNIAGFDCRKAVGIIDDSVAVFGFYTDEILVTGGPESLQGLPGMILGLGVPRLHTTWFATKVEVNGVNMSVVKPATKGKKLSRKEMIDQLDAVLKNWGTYGKSLRYNFVI